MKWKNCCGEESASVGGDVQSPCAGTPCCPTGGRMSKNMQRHMVQASEVASP